MFQGFLRRPLFSGSMLGLILLCFSWFVGYGLAVVTWWSSPAPHLQATLDGAYVHLSWRPPSGSHPTHYAVYRDGEYLAFSGPSGYTDMQASSGRVYVYSVAVIGSDHRQGHDRQVPQAHDTFARPQTRGLHRRAHFVVRR